MLPDKLLEQVTQVAEAYAKAQSCCALAEVAETDAERAHLKARVDYWNSQLSEMWTTLTVAVNSALPPTIYAAPDPRNPVTMPNQHQVEVRGALDGGNRAVSIRLTPAQAVAVAATMIACAALTTQHTGQPVAEILPALPPTPPGHPVPGT